MIKNKNKIESKKYLNKSNSNKFQNHKNIIFISHSKNKSVDLKPSKIQNILLSTNNNNYLKIENFKLNSIYNNKKHLYKEKQKNKPNKLSKKKSPKSKISNFNQNNIINLKSNKLLKKYCSLPNLINKTDKNKKKYFLGPDFFRRKIKHKNKENLNKKSKDSQKENINNYNYNYSSSFINRNNNNYYIKRIINRTNNYKNIIEIKSNQNKENEDINKNYNISSNDNSISDSKKEIKKPLIKSNIFGLINNKPYKNKRCTTSRVSWSQKDNNIKINKTKHDSVIESYKNILEDSLESHDTIYVEDTNMYDYEFLENNLNLNNNEKLYKKIITRKRNLLTESLNNSNLKNISSKCHSTKNNTYNSSEKESIYYNIKNNNIINLNSQNLYTKVNSKRISVLIDNNKNINHFSPSPSFSLFINNNRNKTNIVINKDVTEFLYSEDLIENNTEYNDSNLKQWLTNIDLITYCGNFFENNIYNIDELINKMKTIENKIDLYEYIENTFHIHTPGHIFRILLKLEIDAGLLDDKISKFFIENDENRIKFNKIKPSVLLKQYNSCSNIFNCLNYNAKNKLKSFLKKYHLMHLYYNFCQNGFDLINFVLLQMFSNYFVIDDYILENYFHIYNENDRILLLQSLQNEKNKIIAFIKSDKQCHLYNNDGKTNDLIIDNINLNINSDNFDNYFITKEIENNNCSICNIY